MNRSVKIKDVRWKQSTDTIGVVLVEVLYEEKPLKAYIGIGRTQNPKFDAAHIADYGAKLSFREAQGFFPTLKKEDYAWD